MTSPSADVSRVSLDNRPRELAADSQRASVDIPRARSPSAVPAAPSDAPVASPGTTIASPQLLQQPPASLANDDLVLAVYQRFQVDSPQSVMSDEDVSQDAEGLKTLLKRGAWKSVMRLSNRLMAASQWPHHKLRYRLCRIVAMMKLRMNQAAFNEFVDIGSSNDPKNLFDTYPHLFGDRRGSMVPFSLKLLYAEIFYALGRDPNMDYLAQLRVFCDTKLRELQKPGVKPSAPKTQTALLEEDLDATLTADPLLAVAPTSTKHSFLEELDEESTDTWRERGDRVRCSVITKLVATRDYVPALQLLAQILERYPKDPVLLSCAGRIYLQIGALAAAESLFQRVERVLEEPEKASLVWINRGLLAFNREQFSLAVEHFARVLELTPGHIVAINNQALCYVHLGDVTKAVEILESALFDDPGQNVNEIIVFNLCVLYDLATEKSLDKRHKIAQLVRDHAPDNFNLAALKLPTS